MSLQELHSYQDPTMTTNTPEPFLDKLEQVAPRLEGGLMSEAEEFCLNSRYAFLKIVENWDKKGENGQSAEVNRKMWLQRYYTAMTAGRDLLADFRPRVEERDYFNLIWRNCGYRWEWGRLLLVTDNLDLVLGKIDSVFGNLQTLAKQEDADLAQMKAPLAV